MRKRLNRNSHRASALIRRFGKRHRGADETEWLILEADVASPKTVRRRKQLWVGRAIRLVSLACLLVSVPAVAKWVYNEVFYQNDEFVLQRLILRSDGNLSDRKLIEVANVSVGMRLMELDLGEIRSRLEKLPMVEEAAVSRVMPDRLNIVVKERVPVAWISCPPLGIRPGDMERGFLIDEVGILFRCLDLTEEMRRLPVVESFRMTEPAEGERLAIDGIVAALRVIQGHEALTGYEGMEAGIVRLKSEWSIQCEYRNGLEVTFNEFEVERGLRDLSVILGQLGASSPHLATVNLAARENIPVTFTGEVSVGEISGLVQFPNERGGDATPSPEEIEEKHLRSILRGG